MARNYVPREVKCEIDLIGYDGGAGIRGSAGAAGVRGSDGAAGAECDGGETASGQTTARRFLMDPHVKACPVRFGYADDRRVTGSSASCTAAQEPVLPANVIIFTGKSAEARGTR